MLSHVACGCVSNFCYALEVYFPRTNGALVVGEGIRVVQKSIDNIILENKSSNVEKSTTVLLEWVVGQFIPQQLQCNNSLKYNTLLTEKSKRDQANTCEFLAYLPGIQFIEWKIMHIRVTCFGRLQYTLW